MEAPVAAVKAAIQPASIVKFALGTLVVFAILDVLGWTNWILYPVTAARELVRPPRLRRHAQQTL